MEVEPAGIPEANHLQRQSAMTTHLSDLSDSLSGRKFGGLFQPPARQGTAATSLKSGGVGMSLSRPSLVARLALLTGKETMPQSAKERWRTAGRFADVLETEIK